MKSWLKGGLIGFICGFILIFLFGLLRDYQGVINYGIISIYEDLLFGEGFTPMLGWEIVFLSTLFGIFSGIFAINKKSFLITLIITIIFGILGFFILSMFGILIGFILGIVLGLIISKYIFNSPKFKRQ